MTIDPSVVCTLLIACGTVLILWPLVQYVATGWRARRKDIMDGLSTDARSAYFEMFDRSVRKPPRDQAHARFEELYDRWYGRRFYLLPGALLFLLSLSAMAGVTLTALSFAKYITNPLFELPAPAVAALAGAYLWVVDDHIARARRLDFSPADVLWGALRLIIAVPMGYAFAAAATPMLGTFVAFAIGAFPLTALTALLRRLANKSLGAEATPDETSDDAINLQGVNKAILERLANEDVTTVTQIAYCDPVRLTMRSNLAFNFITDLMNQALAWMYLQQDLDRVRPLGMRGACEIKCLIDDYDNTAGETPEEQAAHALALQALPKIATAIKQEPETLQVVFRQIAEDPFTVFLEKIWTLPDEDAGSNAASSSPNG
jgi:hypothetical protein